MSNQKQPLTQQEIDALEREVKVLRAKNAQLEIANESLRARMKWVAAYGQDLAPNTLPL